MIRPIHASTGRVLADATVLHSGRTTATAECRVTAEDTGKLPGPRHHHVRGVRFKG